MSIRTLLATVLVLLPTVGFAWGFSDGNSQDYNFVRREYSGYIHHSKSEIIHSQPTTSVTSQRITTPLPEINPSSSISFVACGLRLSAKEPTGFFLTEPLHVSSSGNTRGRLLKSADLHVHLSGKGLPRAEVRYSANGVLWSDWQDCKKRGGTEGHLPELYARLRVKPSERYMEAWRAWAYEGEKRNGGNRAEFEAFLEREHPDVLAHEVPLINYVQVRLLPPTEGESCIGGMRVQTLWTVTGIRQ